MTNLSLQCPLCGSMMEIDASMAGMQVACPTCQGVVQTPPLEMGPGIVPAAEPLSLGCPICQGAFQVVPEMAGQQVACPHCQSPVGIPDLWNAGAPPVMEMGGMSMPPFEPPPVEAPDDGLPVVRSGKKKKRIGPNIADLLPPGAESLPPELPPVPAEPAPLPKDDPAALAAALLPPGVAAGGPVTVGEQKAISTTPSKRPVRLPTSAHGKVVPTPDGGYTTLQDKPTMVDTAAGPMEVRKLSPEEKAKRRFRMNLIMYGVCLLILIIAGYVFTML